MAKSQSKVTTDPFEDPEDGIQKKGRMANSDRDKKIKDAEGLFIRGYSLQSISEMENIKVGVATLKQWKKSYDWDEKKQLENISPTEIKSMIRSNIAAIKSGKQMPYKPDDISKLAAAWDKMDDNRKKAVYSMEAFDAFADWFMDITAKSKGEKREANLDLMKRIRTLQNQYIDSII